MCGGVMISATILKVLEMYLRNVNGPAYVSHGGSHDQAYFSIFGSIPR